MSKTKQITVLQLINVLGKTLFINISWSGSSIQRKKQKNGVETMTPQIKTTKEPIKSNYVAVKYYTGYHTERIKEKKRFKSLIDVKRRERMNKKELL